MQFESNYNNILILFVYTHTHLYVCIYRPYDLFLKHAQSKDELAKDENQTRANNEKKKQ